MFQKSSPKRAQLVFRSFERKGFSLFAAMGKEMKVGVLTVATLGTATPALAANSTVPSVDKDQPVATIDDDQTLNEAVVATSRAPLAAEVAARQVMTLSREDLAAAGITSISDVLKISAAVDVRQRGGFGVQTDLGVNGGTFAQIAILVNGVAITNPQASHNTADFPLNLSDIERIEVLEGAASRLFGSQAFSGAVNIVTRPGGAAFEMSTALGSNSTQQMEMRSNLSQLWKDKRFASTLSAAFQKSDGAVSNSDFLGGKAFWQGRFNNERLRIDAQAALSSQEFGANTFYSARFPNQWERTTRMLTSLRGETKTRIRIAPQFSWMRNYDNFQLIRDTHNYENHHRSDVLTAGLNLWTQWALGKTALGAEIRSEDVRSTNVGTLQERNEWVRIPGKTPIAQTDDSGNTIWRDINGGNAYYNKRGKRTNTSLFAEHNLLFEKWTASIGVMAQRNTFLDNRFRLYPGVDVSYRPSETVKIFAAYNKALRLPDYTELSYSSPDHVGNPNLRPEESHHYRIGVNLSPSKVWELQLAGFYTHATNQVAWVLKAATSQGTSTNLNAEIYGVTAAANFQLQKILGKEQPFQSLRLNYAYTTQERSQREGTYQSTYVTEYLRHKFTATLNHSIVSRLGASWNFRLQERNGSFAVWQGGKVLLDGNGNAVVEDYGWQPRLDLKIHWTEANYQLFCDLQNLTNSHKVDFANIATPGFTFMAGLKFQL